MEHDKKPLRARMRSLLASLPPDDLARASAAACAHLVAHQRFARARRLMVFLGTPGEPDVRPAARAAFGAGKVVCAPRMDWDARTMRPVALLAPDAPTEVRRHSVPEPPDGPVVPPADLDLVLVPGLAFDERGFRLGRGAGFYDRFLADARAGWAAARTSGWVVGVCCEAQVLPEVPREAHDQPVDALLTEAGLRVCRWGG